MLQDVSDWLSCVFFIGCAGNDERGGTTNAVTTVAPTSGDSTASVGDGTGATTGSSGADSGPLFDVGTPGTGGGGGDGGSKGCKKVDFLFVIDNSGSMGDEQDSLVASFPGFISTIQQTLIDAQDYHVMVVDTDAAWGGECELLCPLWNNTCPAFPQYPCGQGPPSECDRALGAGVTYPIGNDASNMLCSFSTGRRYMDSTEPDLSAAFQCAAKVGTDGDGGERPMSAMVAALSEDLAQPGGCNEGFLRDDAILVITVITDEEDDDSTGSPDGWFANVVAAKAGKSENIVVLGLINDTDAPQPVCAPDVQDPAKVRSFIDMFPNSIRGSVCEPSYNAFFQQAVDLIDTTCDDFVPPG